MSFKVGNKTFFGGTHIMGIVNVTDNSFYSYSRLGGDDIVERVFKMAEDGAEIIDIGAQSTAPNAKAVSELEEVSRLIPALEVLMKEKDLPPISVDTFYPEVARQALDLGVNMINDVSCLKDDDIARAVASAGASICIMHNRRGSKTKDMWLDKESGLIKATSKALALGIDEDKIIVDGGIGFNLSHDEDKELLQNYDNLSVVGFPLLLGASRKSFLGGEPNTRLTSTLDTTRLAIKKGILFVRVHDIKENMQVIKAYE